MKRGERQLKRLKKGSLNNQSTWFFIFIAPWLLGFLALTLYPMIASAYYSFTNYSALSSPSWIGLQNYQNLFTDPQFVHSVEVTVIYAVSTVCLQLVLGFLVALLLNLRVPGMRLLRTLYYLPNVLPVAATSMLWMFLFLPQYGLVDVVIHFFSGHQGPQWLSDPTWALPALIIMSAWSFGTAMIIFLAGLQGIPQELYEASSIDGANIWHRATRITIPMLTPQILLNLILGVIGAFQTFIQVYMMTSGGPDYATYLYSYSIYINAFQNFNMGLASAQAWILFIVIMILTGAIFKTSSRWVHYDGMGF